MLTIPYIQVMLLDNILDCFDLLNWEYHVILAGDVRCCCMTLRLPNRTFSF